jgi:DNA-binding LacI/PurR family transcriptional regulator
MKNKVLLIGLRSDSVDYEKWPQLTKETLESAFIQVVDELEQNGYEAVWCLTDQGETAEEQVKSALMNVSPDVVLIVAGVRTDPDLFLLFEKIINVVHKQSPNANIAFNQLPFDSVESVQRWAQ